MSYRKLTIHEKVENPVEPTGEAVVLFLVRFIEWDHSVRSGWRGRRRLVYRASVSASGALLAHDGRRVRRNIGGVLPIVVALILVWGGCLTSSNPLSATAPGANLIVNSSFEMNGVPSLAGWQFVDSSGFMFPPEVPSGGGGNSLSMPVAWFSPIRDEGIWTTVPVPSGTHIYAFSCWAKKVGVGGWVLLFPPGIPIDSTRLATSIFIQDTIWTQFSAYDTISTTRADSVIIFLGRGATELMAGLTFYDLCTFELVR